MGDRPRDEGGGTELLAPGDEERRLGPGMASVWTSVLCLIPNVQVFLNRKVMAPSEGGAAKQSSRSEQ
jgi:hypothetical protein